MRRTIMCFIGAMMILSLAACTPTTEKGKTGEVKQTEAAQTAPASTGERKNSVDVNRMPDMTAPDLDVVSVYTVSADGSKLEGTMDAVEEKTPQAMVDLLIEYGVLEEGTEVLSFETDGKPASEEVGPGVVKIPGMVIESDVKEYGTLNLDKLPDGGKDEMIVKAVANTFLENMDVIYLTVQVDGETVMENVSLEDIGK